jgi:hypothetical protein
MNWRIIVTSVSGGVFLFLMLCIPGTADAEIIHITNGVVTVFDGISLGTISGPDFQLECLLLTARHTCAVLSIDGFCRRQHGGHSELPDGVAPIGRFTMAGAGTAIMDFGLHPNISPSCFSPQLVPSPLHAEGAGRRRTGKFGKGGSVAPVTKV